MMSFVGIWLAVNGLWPFVPGDIHDQDRSSLIELIDIFLHLIGVCIVVVTLVGLFSPAT